MRASGQANADRVRSRSLAVYLAGGFRSGWQREIRSALPSLTYNDPSAHGLSDPASYTKWDLDAIRRSDVVFAYLEADNPGGYALALELGFARALGKRIIFVDEQSSIDEDSARYLAMLREVAEITVNSLAEGVRQLRALTAAEGLFAP